VKESSEFQKYHYDFKKLLYDEKRQEVLEEKIKKLIELKENNASTIEKMGSDDKDFVDLINKQIKLTDDQINQL
jgi:hypothetical protein